jgi:hypothetical protein
LSVMGSSTCDTAGMARSVNRRIKHLANSRERRLKLMLLF